MHLGILSNFAYLYSTKRVYEEALLLGIKTEIINTLACKLVIDDKPSVFFENRELNYFDVIYPRLSANISDFGISVVEQFTSIGIDVANSAASISSAGNKFKALQILNNVQIATPKTIFINQVDDILNAIDLIGLPLIIKPIKGMQGRGVILAETLLSAKSTIEALLRLNELVLVQEFIREAKGSDIRCFVVNGKVIASMQRFANDLDFRSNIHQGGCSNMVTLTEDEIDISILALKALGLNIGGVDLLRSNRGPLVIEINSSPGFEALESTSKINVAKEIVSYLATYKSMNI